MLYYKSARNHQSKSCVPEKSHKSQWCEANIISIEIFAPFQFFLVCVKTRLPQLNLNSDNSIAEDLYCLKAIDSNLALLEMEEHNTDALFAVGLVYPNKLLSMCSFDFVFWKYEQDSAFCVIDVLQLAKTGPPVTKNFPLLHLFPSDAIMMARKFYTPYDVNCTNLQFWPHVECCTFWLELANFEAGEKICRCLPQTQTRKLRIKVDRLQYF